MAGRALWVFLAASHLVLRPAFAAEPANGNAPARRFETWEQIRDRWSSVSHQQLIKAAEAGKADAQYYLGATEWAAGQREWLADRPWRVRASANNASGEMVRTNWTGVSEEDIRQAAESGNPGAQWYLDKLASEKALQRRQAAFVWIRKAADQSVVPAEYDVAEDYLYPVLHHFDPDPPADATEGLKWLRKAANDGSAPAQNHLAEMLIAGDIIPSDLPAAIDWLRQAVDQGYARAQLNLAQQYTCGNGEPRTTGETPLALFRKAADAGLPAARFVLAERYRVGLGVPKDYFEAIAWYRKAAASGRVEEHSVMVSLPRVLALVNRNGEATSADDLDDPPFLEAMKLYVKVVDLRNADAQSRIAERYAAGRNAPASPARAWFWYDRAAAQGSSAAARERDKLKPSLTPHDFQQIKIWSEEFVRLAR